MKRLFIFLAAMLMLALTLPCSFVSLATEATLPSGELTTEPGVTEPSTESATEPTTESTTVPTTKPTTTAPAVTSLDKPTGVTFVTATSTSITVKWKAVKNAEKYKIYYAASGNKKYTLAGTTSDTSFTVTGLSNTLRYKIRVRAVAGKVSSKQSDIIKLYTKPAKLARPAFVSRDGASVTIKWNESSTAKLYDVYVATSSKGKYKKITSTDKTTFTYKKKTPEKSYWFKVVPVIKTSVQYLEGPASSAKKASVGKISIKLPQVIRKGEYPEITVPYYNSKVKWTSSDKSVIRIKDGRLYAAGQGKAKLTATYNKKYKRTVTVRVSAPTLSCMSAVYNVTDKEYIYHNRLNERCYPASITKLVTALVALKYMDVNDTIVVGSELNMVEAYSSRCGLKKGEKFKLGDILYGLLLPSGGDAAYTVAVNCARKVSGNPNMGYVAAKNYFVKLMNSYMDKLGATGTHFVNPHGYPVNGHYSTVHDLVLVANKVLKNKTLSRITSTPYRYVTALTGQGHSWRTTNSLLNSYAYYYSPYAIGMKTGTVHDEYTGIIGAFKKNKKTYITVAIGCESYNARYDATHKLIRTYL